MRALHKIFYGETAWESSHPFMYRKDTREVRTCLALMGINENDVSFHCESGCRVVWREQNHLVASKGIQIAQVDTIQYFTDQENRACNGSTQVSKVWETQWFCASMFGQNKKAMEREELMNSLVYRLLWHLSVESRRDVTSGVHKVKRPLPVEYQDYD